MCGGEGHALDRDIAAVAFDTFRKIDLAHVEAARVPITYVQDCQQLVAAKAVLGHVMHRGRRAIAMHHTEGHPVGVEHRRQRAAHGPLLAPHIDALGLVGPSVTPIAPFHALDVVGRVLPRVHALGLPGFVHNPGPRNEPALTSVSQLGADPVRFGLCHRGDQLPHEQLITDSAD